MFSALVVAYSVMECARLQEMNGWLAIQRPCVNVYLFNANGLSIFILNNSTFPHLRTYQIHPFERSTMRVESMLCKPSANLLRADSYFFLNRVARNNSRLHEPNESLFAILSRKNSCIRYISPIGRSRYPGHCPECRHRGLIYANIWLELHGGARQVMVHRIWADNGSVSNTTFGYQAYDTRVGWSYVFKTVPIFVTNARWSVSEGRL